MAYRPYAYDVISVGRPHLEVKRRLFIGQYCAPHVQIRASRLFCHLFSSKMAAGWRQCIRSMSVFESKAQAQAWASDWCSHFEAAYESEAPDRASNLRLRFWLKTAPGEASSRGGFARLHDVIIICDDKTFSCGSHLNPRLPFNKIYKFGSFEGILLLKTTVFTWYITHREGEQSASMILG